MEMLRHNLNYNITIGFEHSKRSENNRHEILLLINIGQLSFYYFEHPNILFKKIKIEFRLLASRTLKEQISIVLSC